MSIKGKLILILFIICTFSSLLTGFVLWNLINIDRNVDGINIALSHVEAMNKVRTGLKNQIKEVMDYIVSGDKKDLSEFESNRLATGLAMDEWTESGDIGQRDPVLLKRYLDRTIIVSRMYKEAASLISNSVDLADAGKQQEALNFITGPVEVYMDLAILPEINYAMDDEVRFIERTFDALHMSMGSMPWLGGRAKLEASNAETAFRYFRLVNEINANLIIEFQEATFFVVAGNKNEARHFIEAGANATKAIEALLYELNVHALHGVEGEEEDLELAGVIKDKQYELLELFEMTRDLKKAGKVEEAYMIFEDVVEPLMRDTISPAIADLMKDSREEVREMGSNLRSLMLNAFIKGTLLLLVIMGSIVFLSIWVIRGIITSLNKLGDGVKSLGTGSLAHRIELEREDEFSDLANHFNEMVENLQETTVSRDLLSAEVIERKQAEERTSHMAYHDSLTGLPNRSLLIDRLKQVLARNQRRDIHVAVIFIDLDRFKVINDTLGHAIGDLLLVAVAERLEKHTRKADTLARQGGDEFIVIAQDIDRIEDITTVAEKITSAFQDAFNVGGHELSITVSMGISVYPNDGEDVVSLLKNADIAMYKAKDEGRNSYQLYTAKMNESIAKRHEIEKRLRTAIKNEEFQLHYQPQVDSATGEIFGLEALLRLQDPGGEPISPGEFIPVAEDTGLIVPIGEWVLHEACRQNKMWQDEGLKQMTVSVNISIRQFKQKEFVSTVERILKETNLEPKYLELELTESVVMDDIESTIETLRALKALGIRLSIDDFGTGYSSLMYLKRMPIDMLKIDQSFVRDIVDDLDDASIVRATIEVAKSLHLEVIAEGVETREQFELLYNLQCNKIQGYLFSRPLPPQELKEFLREEWRFVVECVDAVEQKESRKSA